MANNHLLDRLYNNILKTKGNVSKACFGIILLVMLFDISACGHKGPPLPPKANSHQNH